MTQHVQTQTSARPPLLVRSSVWNVRVCSVTSACRQMCVAPKQFQHGATRNVTPWVGLRTPTRVIRITAAGRGNLRQACGLQVLIRSIGPVCIWFSSEMTIPQPNTCSPSYPCRWTAFIHMRWLHCHFLSCVTDTRAEPVPPCRVSVRSPST